MHNIAFFSNHFARRDGTGITRYARDLLRAFKKRDSQFDVIPVATWSNKEKNDLNTFQAKTGLRLLSTGRWLTPLLWGSIKKPKLEHLVNFPVDIIHVNTLGYLVATSKPYVVTVHDIGPLTHPEYFKHNSSVIVQRILEKTIKKADAIICVSQTTANSLEEYVQKKYSIDLSNRIYTVHEGISEKFFQPPNLLVLNQDSELDFLQQPLILAVGKISPRKNLEAVIRALKNLQPSIPHHLVMVGGGGWDFQETKSLVSSLGLTDRVHFLGYVSDEELHALYAHATLFIYPSLFEGFGLTVLEAMACGCPVITSNTSSLPEVAGDAALLVDPHNLDEITAAIEMICNDHGYADELRQKGRERAKQFSWENCAEGTSRIYNNLLS